MGKTDYSDLQNYPATKWWKHLRPCEVISQLCGECWPYDKTRTARVAWLVGSQHFPLSSLHMLLTNHSD